MDEAQESMTPRMQEYKNMFVVQLFNIQLRYNI